MSLTLSVGQDDVGETQLTALSVSSSTFASSADSSTPGEPRPSLVRKNSLDSQLSTRPRGLSRTSTLPRVSLETTKLRRKNSELDALVVEPDVLIRIRRWILGVAIVDFDVDDGPVVTGIYPPLVVFPAEAENIAFSAFPDSPQFEDGSQDHSFRIRESPLPLPSDRRPPPKDGFIYGFAHFTQRKDASSRRGYEQRSLVILTHHPYPALFARITSLLGPLFQEHGLPMLEAACHNIATWCDPTPGMNDELGFLGTVLSVEIPLSPEQQQLAGKGYDPRLHILASSSSFTPPPLLLFEAALSHLWSIWECLVLSRPCGGCATSSVPLPLTGDVRPYFTIHDTDHAALASRLPPAAGRILGVTNPVFERACAHWPHVLSLGRNIPLNTASHGASAGNTRARAGPPPGWKTRTHTRYVSKDRTLLRRLEDTRPSTSGGTSTPAPTELLVPLCALPPHPHPHTRLSAPLHRSPCVCAPLVPPAFLASLKSGSGAGANANGGAVLPFRSTARRKEFYERWLRTPAFGVWLGMQEGIVQGVLEGG
ncbi:hypothetical protein B0H16DRAFT_1675642 [Mycena metata]|uniref:UDENN domain-containing protein n=1 Tax=Mycena metata TaxID=1033252 RepID=A0AAD7N654_9AGAR|nr:hypothetical protein B0H16DRAFT_1675642 [Mycena metata]